MEDQIADVSHCLTIKKEKRDVGKAKYKLRDLALVTTLAYTGCKLREALKLKSREKELVIVPAPSKLFWDIMERYLKTDEKYETFHNSK